MSKPYKEYKVGELKELIRERGLSLAGTKSELISRLEEADALLKAEESKAEPEPEPAAEPVAEPEPAAPAAPAEPEAAPEPAPVAAAAEPAQAAEPTKPAESAKPAESVSVTAPPEVSDEELLARVKTDLTAQIERAKRFGGDAAELEARLRRISKFGIAAVRDAATKANAAPLGRRGHGSGNGRRKNRNRKRNNGPKPAVA